MMGVQQGTASIGIMFGCYRYSKVTLTLEHGVTMRDPGHQEGTWPVQAVTQVTVPQLCIISNSRGPLSANVKMETLIPAAKETGDINLDKQCNRTQVLLFMTWREGTDFHCINRPLFMSNPPFPSSQNMCFYS